MRRLLLVVMAALSAGILMSVGFDLIDKPSRGFRPAQSFGVPQQPTPVTSQGGGGPVGLELDRIQRVAP